MTILVQHKGIWDSNKYYNNYDVDAILVNATLNFTNLIEIIATQLQKDVATSNVEIKNALSDSTTENYEQHRRESLF
ncbi:hypothetical protein RDI58_004131 [Solanum bulbocastanum]|uniref:Uncharacterized protein n=1 Tax=Solanum bulbocastanum TaxID=147425 RepID=A0AAN8TYJ8_SOLBU